MIVLPRFRESYNIFQISKNPFRAEKDIWDLIKRIFSFILDLTHGWRELVTHKKKIEPCSHTNVGKPKVVFFTLQLYIEPQKAGLILWQNKTHYLQCTLYNTPRRTLPYLINSLRKRVYSLLSRFLPRPPPLPPRIYSTTELISHKESIPWNRCLGSLKVWKFRLWCVGGPYDLSVPRKLLLHLRVMN